MIKPFQARPPGMPRYVPKPPRKPPPSLRQPDPRKDHQIIAVGHQRNTGSTYIMLGTGMIRLFWVAGWSATAALAQQRNRATAYYERHIIRQEGYEVFDLDQPPLPAVWYWVDVAEVRARGLQARLDQLAAGEWPDAPARP